MEKLEQACERIDGVHAALFDVDDWTVATEDFCDELSALFMERDIQFWEATDPFFYDEIKDQVNNADELAELLNALLNKYETKYLIVDEDNDEDLGPSFEQACQRQNEY